MHEIAKRRIAVQAGPTGSDEDEFLRLYSKASTLRQGERMRLWKLFDKIVERERPKLVENARRFGVADPDEVVSDAIYLAWGIVHAASGGDVEELGLSRPLPKFTFQAGPGLAGGLKALLGSPTGPGIVAGVLRNQGRMVPIQAEAVDKLKTASPEDVHIEREEYKRHDPRIQRELRRRIRSVLRSMPQRRLVVLILRKGVSTELLDRGTADEISRLGFEVGCRVAAKTVAKTLDVSVETIRTELRAAEKAIKDTLGVSKETCRRDLFATVQALGRVSDGNLCRKP